MSNNKNKRLWCISNLNLVLVRARNKLQRKGEKVLGWKIVHSQVEMLKKEEKFKTASNYLTAARSWTKFLQREDWTFSEMDSQEVELYQRWLSDKGICLNTISAYLRSLRAMYNRWAEEYSSNDDVCPFTKAFTGRTKTAKRSITESEIRKLHDLDLEEGSTLAMSRDIFILVLCNGDAFCWYSLLKEKPDER